MICLHLSNVGWSSAMSVAASPRRLEQYDVIWLQGELLEIAHRLAIDMEFSGRARRAATQALRTFVDAARDRVEQPLVLGLEPELNDLAVAAAHRAVTAGAGAQFLALKENGRHRLDDFHRNGSDASRIA